MRMNDFLHALQAELNATKPNFGDDANTVLGLLYGAYNEYNGTDTNEIKQAFEELYQAMNSKTLREKDEVIDTVCRLCGLHQQTGFIDGIKIGMKLMEELTMST